VGSVSTANTENFSLCTMQNRTAATYIPPTTAINTWLTNMGLAGINSIATFNFFVTSTPFPIPVDIAPVFFSNLAQSDVILITECNSCATNTSLGPISPATNRLKALPGFAVNYQNTFTSFTLQNTGAKFCVYSHMTKPPLPRRGPAHTEREGGRGRERERGRGGRGLSLSVAPPASPSFFMEC
jgi:hypothetical protein